MGWRSDDYEPRIGPGDVLGLIVIVAVCVTVVVLLRLVRLG